MREPIARAISKPELKDPSDSSEHREPRAFTAPEMTSPIETISDIERVPAGTMISPKKPNWLLRIFAGAFGILVSLGLGLAADRLIRDLFLRYEWLGWFGLGVVSIVVITLIVLAAREVAAVNSLRKLEHIREMAAQATHSNDEQSAKFVLSSLQELYRQRADMARPREDLARVSKDLLDSVDLIAAAEVSLMQSLDAKVKVLTAASARRVAIVTAISPRAIVDIAFVGYESLKLARTIAVLYGVRPGLMGSFRLAGAILGHLAITGGVALGDSVIQQLVGHGLAAKMSARLGEGLVNGLMTVRVGIAAMRVTRPLPFDKLKQPVVMDYMADLTNLTKEEQNQN